MLKSADAPLIFACLADYTRVRVPANAEHQGARSKKVAVLFGPRSTGKTTLLRAQFDARAIVNLLPSSEYLPLAENPSRLREIVAEGRADASTGRPVVVIDEIQKLPALLDEVHDPIETEGLHFVLSGSSGRKLKRSGVNLLAGRAWQANLFPLTSAEIPEFNLGRYLLHGGLPQVYDSEYPDSSGSNSRTTPTRRS